MLRFLLNLLYRIFLGINYKRMYEELKEEHEKLRASYEKLREDHDNQILQNNELLNEIRVLNDEKRKLIELQKEHKKLLETYNKLKQDYETLVQNHESLSGLMIQTTEELKSLEKENKTLKKENENLQFEIKSLQTRCEEIERERDVFVEKYEKILDKLQELNDMKNELELELQRKEKELKIVKDELADLSKKLRFLSLILNQDESQENRISKIKSILEEEFVDIVTQIPYKAGEKAIIKLKSIIEKLEFVLSFKEKVEKNIVAVCGGFSTGKSSFINSVFLRSGITNFKLSTDITPTTAIPTYLIHGDSLSIKVVTMNNKLKLIEPEYLEMFKHDIVKNLGFHIRKFVQSLIISHPFRDFENICVIDTPGYNPGSSISVEDRQIALRYLEEANAIIWLIGLDVSGTIPKSDIDFLKEVNLTNKSIYIVLNKADLRSFSDIKEIANTVKNELSKNYIKVDGIAAYSCITNKEMFSIGKTLTGFLKEQNKPINLMLSIINDLQSIFKEYEDFLLQDLNEVDTILKALKGMKLDIFQVGMDEKLSRYTTFYDKLEKLKLNFRNKSSENKKLLKELSNIKIKVLRELGVPSEFKAEFKEEFKKLSLFIDQQILWS